MPITAVFHIDLVEVARQELRVSLLCSLFASHSLSPHFPRVYRIFRGSFPPPFSRPLVASTDYLFVETEVATRRDVEQVLRTSDLSDAATLSVFFQMVLSLFAANETVSLRRTFHRRSDWFITTSNFPIFCSTKRPSAAPRILSRGADTRLPR